MIMGTPEYYWNTYLRGGIFRVVMTVLALLAILSVSSQVSKWNSKTYDVLTCQGLKPETLNNTCANPECSELKISGECYAWLVYKIEKGRNFNGTLKNGEAEGGR